MRSSLVLSFRFNPIIFLVFLYGFSNVWGAIDGVDNGGYQILGKFYSISKESYFLSIVIILFFLSILLFYLFFSFRCSIKERVLLGRWGSLFVIFYMLSYFAFFNITGAGVLGAERNLSSPFGYAVNYLFKVFSPDLLAILMLPLFKSNRFFYVGAFVYVLSTILRGWMGGVFIVGLIYLIRFYPVRLSFKHLFLFLVLVALLPFIEGVKWGIRGGYELVDVLSVVYNGYHYDVICQALTNVLQRFQHVNNVALIVENIGFFQRSYEYGDFRPFYVNGIFADIYCKLTGSCFLDVNAFLVDQYYDPGASWNVDPGISGWFFFDGLTSVI